MTELRALIKRNTKLFFKDKGMFFTSLITPLILLVLYSTFLAKVYRDSLSLSIPVGFSISDELINAAVGAQLFSSLLAVCCVTVAFCSNMLMVQDKANGTVVDLYITPVKPSSLALGYYLSTVISTLIICYFTMLVSFVYMAVVGWYLSVADVLLLILDIFLLVLFGTALSSIINFFLNSQGQISAVGTIVSSGYGFICGAYMPLSQFGDGLRNTIMFLPGTYGTSLLKNHAMRGAFAEMENEGLPPEAVKEMKDALDCNLYFLDNGVDIGVMYAVIAGTVCLLIALYILLNYLKIRKRKVN